MLVNHSHAGTDLLTPHKAIHTQNNTFPMLINSYAKFIFNEPAMYNKHSRRLHCVQYIKRIKSQTSLSFRNLFIYKLPTTHTRNKTILLMIFIINHRRFNTLQLLVCSTHRGTRTSHTQSNH